MESTQDQTMEPKLTWIEDYGIKIISDETTTSISDTDTEDDLWIKQSTTSKVYLAHLESSSEQIPISDKKYAVKVSLFPHSKIDTILKEVDLLSSLDHKNIIKPIIPTEETKGSSISGETPAKSPKFAFMVTDFEERGDLFMKVSKDGRLDKPTVKNYFKQTLDAVKYLHDLNIVHRDIKLSNILLSEGDVVKLIDFGHSSNLDFDIATDKNFLAPISKVNEIKGTQGYVSPEMLDIKAKIWEHLESTGVSKSDGPKAFIDLKKTDIFALGVILFEMMVGVPPFCHANWRDRHYRNFYFKKKVERFWLVHSKAKELCLSGEIDDDFKDLIEGLLTPFPDQRLSLEEIESHPWFKSK